MSAAGLVIPEEVVEKVTLQLFGPDAAPWVHEAVEMALSDVSRPLYDTWVPPPVQCANTSCFNVTCELSEGHEGFHTAHLGTASAAWAAGRAS